MNTGFSGTEFPKFSHDFESGRYDHFDTSPYLILTPQNHGQIYGRC
jgi:hypothetical protein